MKPKIYLCGRISGLTYSESQIWRRFVEAELGYNFELLNPMRDKKELDQKEELHGAYPEHILCRHDLIMLRDSLDIERADVVLVYVHPEKGLGRASFVEIGFALAKQKPIIVVDSQGSLREHAFFKTMPRLVFEDTFEEAFIVLRSLFNI